MVKVWSHLEAFIFAIMCSVATGLVTHHFTIHRAPPLDILQYQDAYAEASKANNHQEAYDACSYVVAYYTWAHNDSAARAWSVAKRRELSLAQEQAKREVQNFLKP